MTRCVRVHALTSRSPPRRYGLAPKPAVHTRKRMPPGLRHGEGLVAPRRTGLERAAEAAFGHGRAHIAAGQSDIGQHARVGLHEQSHVAAILQRQRKTPADIRDPVAQAALTPADQMAHDNSAHPARFGNGAGCKVLYFNSHDRSPAQGSCAVHEPRTTRILTVSIPCENTGRAPGCDLRHRVVDVWSHRDFARFKEIQDHLPLQ